MKNGLYSLELNIKDMVKTSIFVILAAIVGYAGRYAVNLLLAKYLGPEHYGDYACLINVVFLGAIVLLVGAGDVTNKYIPIFVVQKQWGRAASFLKSQSNVIMLTFFLTFMVGGLFFTSLYILERFHYITILEFHPAIFAFWFAPLFAVITYQAKLLQSIRQVYASLITFKVLPFLLMILGVVIFAGMESKVAMFQILGVYGFALLAVATVQFVLLMRSFPREIIHHTVYEKPVPWIKISAMMMIFSFIFTGIQAIDLLMLELLGPSEAEVGVFAAIMTITGCFAVIPVAFGPIVNPLISVFVLQSDRNLLQRFVTKYNLIALVFLSLLLITIVVFGKAILLHFGAQFVTGYPLLVTLTPFVFCLAFIDVIADPLLKYSDKQNYLVIVTGIGALIAIICDAVLMPTYGMYGVILGVLLSRVFIITAIVVEIRKHFHIKGLIFL